MKIALRYKKLPFSTKKSGASDSAFSSFNPRYCSLVSKGKVWIKVCNSQSGWATLFGYSLHRLCLQRFSHQGFAILRGHDSGGNPQDNCINRKPKSLICGQYG